MASRPQDSPEPTPHVVNASESEPREANWQDWWRVGCGVESLHAVLTDTGHVVTLDETLADALALDGYDDAVGWRHRALVTVARRHGLEGDVVGELTPEVIRRGGVSTRWLVSVRAPEQFSSTHLIAVHLVSATGAAATPTADVAFTATGAPRVEVFWPQGHLEFGERFEVALDWLAPRMTGRGMRFDVPAEQSRAAETATSE